MSSKSRRRHSDRSVQNKSLGESGWQREDRFNPRIGGGAKSQSTSQTESGDSTVLEGVDGGDSKKYSSCSGVTSGTGEGQSSNKGYGSQGTSSDSHRVHFESQVGVDLCVDSIGRDVDGGSVERKSYSGRSPGLGSRTEIDYVCGGWCSPSQNDIVGKDDGSSCGKSSVDEEIACT